MTCLSNDCNKEIRIRNPNNGRFLGVKANPKTCLGLTEFGVWGGDGWPKVPNAKLKCWKRRV